VSADSARPSLHVYENYGWLRGFNVIPSWAARIEQAWWDYRSDRFREEITLATQVHANCIRLWVELTAWMADPEKVTENFMDAVAAIDEAGMKTMPCLFNMWHNLEWDYGGTYQSALPKRTSCQSYLESIVAPLVQDERILLWDLCNEPKAHVLATLDKNGEYLWLKSIAQIIRDLGVRQPVTIGTMFGDYIRAYAPLVDVLCGHPYARACQAMAGSIRSLASIQQQAGKSMLVNECFPGSLDDIKRAELTRCSAKLLSEADFGWMGWSLKEGRTVSTRRDRYDANGINGEGFHAWFTADGKLRDGLEFLTETPRLQPPWKK